MLEVLRIVVSRAQVGVYHFRIRADGRADGATSSDGRVAGCYVHGLFASDEARAAFLAEFGAKTSGESYETGVDAVLDRFADHLARHVDIERLLTFAK